MNVERRSLILKVFDKKEMFELERVTLTPTTNNIRGIIAKEMISDICNRKGLEYESLGVGTNRLGIKVDGTVIKVSLDSAGKTDNQREFKYSKCLQPYVTKTYECLPTGLFASSEYIVPFGIDDFYERKNEMRSILKEITDAGYLIGDVGITGKNYVNWGIRQDNTIAILDFAYIYDVKFNTFKCDNCPSASFLRWDDNYVVLTCPSCGHKYEFGEIRRRITRDQQKNEIGDIKKIGYNLTSPIETVVYNPSFEFEKDKKKEKVISESERLIREYEENNKPNEWF